MNIYFISGLGVDERAFKNIHLPNDYVINHIKWIALTPNENLLSYSKRLIEQIDQSSPFIIVGLSFGGIIATEISNIIPVKKTILISSTATSLQYPWYLKIARSFKLNKLIPIGLLNKSNKLLFWAFGAISSEQKNLLKEINHKPDLKFTKWAIDEIINWKRISNNFRPIQIHGTADKLFPIKSIQADYRIKNGGHFMIFSDAVQLSEKLSEILSSE